MDALHTPRMNKTMSMFVMVLTVNRPDGDELGVLHIAKGDLISLKRKVQQYLMVRKLRY